MEKNAFRWFDTELLEQLGVAHRQLDHFANLFEFAIQSTDILVGDAWRPARTAARGPFADLFCGLFADRDLRAVGDDHGS